MPTNHQAFNSCNPISTMGSVTAVPRPVRPGKRDPGTPKVIAITERAKQAGALRGDIEGTDLVFVQVALLAVVERSRDGAADLYRCYLHVILDGVRAPPTTRASFPCLPSPSSKPTP